MCVQETDGVGVKLERPLSDTFRKWSLFFISGDRNKEKGGETSCSQNLHSFIHKLFSFIQQVFTEWLPAMSMFWIHGTYP